MMASPVTWLAMPRYDMTALASCSVGLLFLPTFLMRRDMVRNVLLLSVVRPFLSLKPRKPIGLDAVRYICQFGFTESPIDAR